MGTFNANLKISNLYDASRSEELSLMVDTGAAFSWIARKRLESLGVPGIRRMRFRTIEGHLIERELAEVRTFVGEFSGPDTVVVAEPGDMELMGALSIEGLGLAADPVQHRLTPTVGLALTAIILGD
jgi:predicted aspartyl protease